MIVYYRISSGSYNKQKLPNATKEHCLENFIKEFGASKDKWSERPVIILIVPSKANHELNNYFKNELKEYIDKINRFGIFPLNTDYSFSEMLNNMSPEEYSKKVPPNVTKEEFIKRLKDHNMSNAQSFNSVYKSVCDDTKTIPDWMPIYFVEDDYLHLPNSYKVLKEGLQRADYVSLYDHNDKYMDPSPNPYVEDGGEVTKVILTESTHWKLTNSTTMTFASTAKILREDRDIWVKWTSIDSHPRDFDAFIELRNKGRSLITPIPSYSTHTETSWLSPLIDWSKI